MRLWPVLVRMAPDLAGLDVLLFLACGFVLYLLGSALLKWILQRLNR